MQSWKLSKCRYQSTACWLKDRDMQLDIADKIFNTIYLGRIFCHKKLPYIYYLILSLFYCKLYKKFLVLLVLQWWLINHYLTFVLCFKTIEINSAYPLKIVQFHRKMQNKFYRVLFICDVCGNKLTFKGTSKHIRRLLDNISII